MLNKVLLLDQKGSEAHSHVIIRTSYGGFQVLNSSLVPMCGCWERNLRKVGEKKKESRGATSTLRAANTDIGKWASRAGRAILATLAPGNTDPRFSFILKVDRVAERRLPDVIFSRWWSTSRATIK